MSDFKKFSGKALSRAELSHVKGQGGVNCQAVYVACDANCGHFSTSYGAFASCVDTGSNHGCSPLAGWVDICGNYN